MQKSGGAAIPMQLNSELMKFRIGNEETIKQMPELSVDMPFAEGRIDFLNEISRELLKDKEAKRYPDVVTFAFWIRRANMEKEKEKFLSDSSLRMGRGVSFTLHHLM